MGNLISEHRFSSVQRFLLLRHDAVGDFMTMVPALKAIKRFFPHSEIVFLASNYSRNHLIAEQCPYVDEVVIAPDLNDSAKCSEFKSSFAPNSFDCIVHASADSRLVSLLRHASKIHVGDKSILSLWWLFRKWGRWVSPNDLMRHQVDYHFMLLKAFKIPEELYSQFDASFSPVFPPSNRMTELLKENGRRNKVPLIAIQVGSAGGNKPVYPNKYKEFCIGLRKKIDCDIVLIGHGSEEEVLAKEISLGLPFDPINLVSKVPLQDLFLFFKDVDLLVGVDTGPIHMATALDLPILLLSTSKRITPFKWGPWMARHLVLRQNSECPIPCKARVCELTQCSDDLSSSKMVLSAIELLDGGGVSTYDDAQLHWFQVSMHVVILYSKRTYSQSKEYADQLEGWGVKVWLLPINTPKLTGFLIENDIRIIHNFSRRRRLRLFFSALSMNLKEVHFPLILNSREHPVAQEELLPFYRAHFRARF